MGREFCDDGDILKYFKIESRSGDQYFVAYFREDVETYLTCSRDSKSIITQFGFDLDSLVEVEETEAMSTELYSNFINGLARLDSHKVGDKHVSLFRLGRVENSSDVRYFRIKKSDSGSKKEVDYFIAADSETSILIWLGNLNNKSSIASLFGYRPYSLNLVNEADVVGTENYGWFERTDRKLKEFCSFDVKLEKLVIDNPKVLGVQRADTHVSGRIFILGRKKPEIL